MFCLFCLFFLSDSPEPMKVKPGDPVLKIQINTLAQNTLQLDQVLDSSLCFILSLDCRYCQDAMAIVTSTFADAHHTAILFVDAPAKVKLFLKNNPLPSGIDTYLVNPKELKPHNINTMPALLGYKRGRLKLAFHGPLDQEKANWLLRMYEKKFSRPK